MVPGQLWNVNQRFFKGTQSDLPLTGHFETSKENCGHLRTLLVAVPSATRGFAVGAIYSAHVLPVA
jgi:hypothetical protein